MLACLLAFQMPQNDIKKQVFNLHFSFRVGRRLRQRRRYFPEWEGSKNNNCLLFPTPFSFFLFFVLPRNVEPPFSNNSCNQTDLFSLSLSLAQMMQFKAKMCFFSDSSTTLTMVTSLITFQVLLGQPNVVGQLQP